MTLTLEIFEQWKHLMWHLIPIRVNTILIIFIGDLIRNRVQQRYLPKHLCSNVLPDPLHEDVSIFIPNVLYIKIIDIVINLLNPPPKNIEKI